MSFRTGNDNATFQSGGSSGSADGRRASKSDDGKASKRQASDRAKTCPLNLKGQGKCKWVEGQKGRKASSDRKGPSSKITATSHEKAAEEDARLLSKLVGIAKIPYNSKEDEPLFAGKESLTESQIRLDASNLHGEIAPDATLVFRSKGRARHR